MKKLITAILAVLYLGTSSGASIHMHYCMGKLADWGLSHNKSKTCGNCGMEKADEKDNGCCKDEHKFVKNETDQKTAESVILNFTLPVVDLPVSFFSISEHIISSITEEYPLCHAPPRSCGLPVYLLNRTFRI
ncbi:MAG: hypothetical protein V9E88_13540 [Ferruginibacter sp.]